MPSPDPLYRFRGLAVPLDDDTDPQALAARLSRAVRLPVGAIHALTIERQAVDARAGQGAAFVFTLRFRVQGGGAPSSKYVETLPESETLEYAIPRAAPSQVDSTRPIVIGFGPAGLFAALALARAGRPPVVLERGKPALERARDVAAFWHAGTLDADSNVLYGEGGAGLYSDGKLTSRSKDRRRERFVRAAFVGWGAPESVLYDAAAHLGTDRMHGLMAAARAELCALGAEIRFGVRVTDFLVEEGRLRGVVAGPSTWRTDHCILAAGHSARDLYRVLARRGVPLEPKPFAVGVRIEQPQRRIDAAQWGPLAGHPRLGAASYRLSLDGAGRDIYTFCMCPGGQVVACASEAGGVCSNGMSNARRDQPNGNAAFVVPVLPADLAVGGGGLAGLVLQEAIESAAFTQGGGTYALPACRLGEILDGAPPRRPFVEGDGAPHPRCLAADPLACFPDAIRTALAGGIRLMARRYGRLLSPEDAVIGVETRTSSPVRIVRGDSFDAPGMGGLYPCGEGAGYAGGIISSAIDGLQAAEAVLGA